MFDCQICDFGISKLCTLAGGTSGAKTAAGAGTLAFMAPEIRMGGQAVSASDIFSLGMLAVQVLTREPPGVHDCEGQVRNAVKECDALGDQLGTFEGE